MSKNFDLASLIPKEEDQPTYTDKDGVVYPVKMKHMFTPLELVKLDGMFAAIQSIRSSNGQKASDKIKAKKLESVYNNLFSLFLPDLPKDRQTDEVVPFMIKRQFVDWWHEEMKKIEEKTGLLSEETKARIEAMTAEELADLGEGRAN
jgi:hypothetical protein